MIGRFILLGLVLLAAPALAADGDADGVDDGFDNCTLEANVGQEDDDADGYGNLCDQDLDQSGTALIGDFARFRACWQQQQAGTPWALACDFDSSGLLTARDLAILRLAIGSDEKPGPSALVP